MFFRSSIFSSSRWFPKARFLGNYCCSIINIHLLLTLGFCVVLPRPLDSTMMKSTRWMTVEMMVCSFTLDVWVSWNWTKFQLTNVFSIDNLYEYGRMILLFLSDSGLSCLWNRGTSILGRHSDSVLLKNRYCTKCNIIYGKSSICIWAWILVL